MSCYIQVHKKVAEKLRTMKTVDNQMTWGLILHGLQLQHKSYNIIANHIIQICVHCFSIYSSKYSVKLSS